MKDRKVKFEVWREVKLGTVEKDELPEVLKSQGCDISGGAWKILEDPGFRAASKETEVKLVKLTLAQLGFKEDTSAAEVYERGEELGLKMCPAEVGPQLRLQYPDQVPGERIIVAMKPIQSRVFGVDHNNFGKYLNCVNLQGVWKRRWLAPTGNYSCWVFCLKRDKEK